MWIEDLTKALYFLNATEYKYSVCIEKIEDNIIFFSNGTKASVFACAKYYDIYIKTGKIAKL